MALHTSAQQLDDFARRQMLMHQLRCAEVLDRRVLATLERLPREFFVPAAFRRLAFADTEIPLAHGQAMLTPLNEGRILQALDIRPQDRVLEIGTGSGYMTACLARLGSQVTSIDIFPDLIDSAQQKLDELGIVNCELRIGDAFSLAPGEFDVIAVTGSLPAWDTRFEQWLRPGGRLLLVVGRDQPMEAWRVERRLDGGEWQRRALFETVIPPLLHAPEPAEFLF